MIRFENAVKKFNALILDELSKAGINCWIAGGIVRNYFMAEHLNSDIDIFFPDELEFTKCARYLESVRAKILYSGDHGTKYKYKNMTLDVIKHFFDSPQSTIEAFDFTVAMFAVSHDQVYYGEHSFFDLAKRQLMINKITYPESSMSRVLRYYTKGFLMCNEELGKLLDAVKGLSVENTSKDAEDLEDTEKEPRTSFSRFRGID